MENTKQIIIAGTGGQGLMVAGNILSTSATEKEDKYVTQRNFYGAEKRGGIAYTEVKISNEEILFPNVEKADVIILLHQNAVKKFLDVIDEKVTIIYDSEEVDISEYKNKTNKIYGAPFIKIARSINAVQSLNIISLGALTKILNIVSKENLIDTITTTFPKKADGNKDAFIKGYESIEA